MKNTWKKHVALIEASCRLMWATENVVWFFDGEDGICEFRSGASFPCSSWDEFSDLCSAVDQFEELD